MSEDHNATTKDSQSKVNHADVSVYKVPTEEPESDGTLVWNSTTMILTEIEAAGKKGIGYTYAHVATQFLVEQLLKECVIGSDPMEIERLHVSMKESVRNNGNAGITFMAISAIDIALWDLKSKILDLPLSDLLGKANQSFPIYGSGGFTSYSESRLTKQLGNWIENGFNHVKMKIGRNPGEDTNRVRAVREIIGNKASLFVDANGAYTVKQALKMAMEFNDYDVSWFEEPVSSDNLRGLQHITEFAPPGMHIAAGEYGYQLNYFESMIRHGSVDILQADATRCGGITGFIKTGHLCEANGIPFSSHCAPSLHMQAALSLPVFYIGEYFYDHVRIERMFFDGLPDPVNGVLIPDASRPGLGLEFKYADAKKFRVS